MSAGSLSSNFVNASNPPAEAPMPTMGKWPAAVVVSGLDVAVCLVAGLSFGEGFFLVFDVWTPQKIEQEYYCKMTDIRFNSRT